jgi:hypothetical protein
MRLKDSKMIKIIRRIKFSIITGMQLEISIINLGKLTLFISSEDSISEKEHFETIPVNKYHITNPLKTNEG